MSELETQIEDQTISDFAIQSYHDYGQYVVGDRAIPSVADGLKPVQRRIIYSMHGLGIKHTGKHKKAARTVGDVLGKFHPHGDTACYEAMVQMVQPFNYRYPLIDGQGNWGSADNPKSFAAMRYTESRLQKFTGIMLDEIGKGTVEWEPNFDGSLQEPSLLPSRIPYVLANGGTGIAVGWATNIAPHNIKELIDATKKVLYNPEITLQEILKDFKGPDFPTGCDIALSDKGKEKMYQTGRGKVVMRSIWHEEDGNIVIDKLPFRVSGEDVILAIAKQMNDKKLPLVSDIQDESDKRSPTRIVIIPKSKKTDLDMLMSHLFATTALQDSFGVNMTVLGLNERPKLVGLMEILSEWIEFRFITVTKRTQHRLEKVLARLHILEGLLVAFLNIDEVIEIIRGEDEPKPVMMERFGITDIQATAILEIRLRQLAKLEEFKIRGEQSELEKEKDYLEGLLADTSKMRDVISEELDEDCESFGDERICNILSDEKVVEAKAFSKEDLAPSEPITVFLSKKGWIKTAKGYDVDGSETSYKGDDSFLMQCNAKSNSSLVIFDDEGRSFTLPIMDLPGSRGFGEPISKWVKLTSTNFESMISVEKEAKYLMSTEAGYGFIMKGEDMIGNKKAGKAILSLAGSKMMMPIKISEHDTHIFAFNNEGYLLGMEISDVKELPKGKGVKLINLKDGEKISLLSVVNLDKGITMNNGNKDVDFDRESIESWINGRAKRGKRPPHGFTKVIKEINTHA